MDENNEELKVLFKVLEKDGKITVNDINKLTRKLENVGKPPEKPQKYKKDDSEENDKDNSIDYDEDERDKLKYFPNKKTSINFEDFCTIYNDSMESLSKDDDMIAKIFEMFDLDADGKLNAFNIKQILEVFGFKSNIQDVKNVLRQSNVTDTNITQKDFKVFFNKILNEE